MNIITGNENEPQILKQYLKCYPSVEEKVREITRCSVEGQVWFVSDSPGSPGKKSLRR